MGKKQHSKDRLFLSATEWREEGGGRAAGRGGVARARDAEKRRGALPFHCCALGLAPFQDPVCCPEGHCFDVVNIVPYVREHGVSPVTGRPLKLGDLRKLHFHRDSAGAFCCPVLGKVFTPSSKIVAVRSTGNVFSHEAVSELNLKPRNWVDLLSGEPFTRSDLLTLQDPDAPAGTGRVEAFHHVLKGHEPGGGAGARQGAGGGARSADVQRVMAELEKRGGGDKTSAILKRAGGAGGARPEPAFKPSAHTWDTDDYTKGGASAGAGAGARAGGAAGGDPEARRIQKMWAERAGTEESQQTTGRCSGSFTSTALDVQTRNLRQRQVRQLRPDKKGYARLRTSLGDLNVELHCDIVPRTCENFLVLCEEGYYDGTPFHRCVRNFMVQGGDPTGTGKGGESIYGRSFPDEIDSRLLHSGRGVLSMANSGKDSNGSQFFVLFKSAKHLDFKHSVFGRVVGGLDVLARLEGLETDAQDRPLQEAKVLGAEVFVDPFAEMRRQGARAEVGEPPAEAGARPSGGTWFSTGEAQAPGAVGALLPKSGAAQAGAGKQKKRGAGPAGLAGGGAKKVKGPEGQGRGGGYGNFDAW